MTVKQRCIELIVAVGLLLSSQARSDVYVIVNAENSLNNITAEGVERIFLKKAKRFENDLNAEPIALAEGSKQRTSFNKLVLQRDEQQLKYYWSRKMFSGGDRPPGMVNSEAEVVALVAQKQEAIGYVTTRPTDAHVKVVLQLKE